MRGTSISREKARKILEAADMADEWDDQGDYFIVWIEGGREYLAVWGGEPIVYNRTATSWL